MFALYLAMLDDAEEQQTFIEFYETYWQAMYRMAYRILGQKELAEDAVHNAFLAILTQMKKVKDFGKQRSYIFAITLARNKAIDIWKKERKRIAFEEVDDEHFIFHMDESEFTTILDEIPELYGTILNLYVIGFKPREIAKLQNKDVETVYKQIARGREILRKKMKEEQDG